MTTSDSCGKVIYLSESLQILSSIFENSVVAHSFIPQPQATIEGIFQIDKLKDRKKNSKFDSLLAVEYSDESEITIDSLLFDDSLASTIPLLILQKNTKPNFYDELFFFLL